MTPLVHEGSLQPFNLGVISPNLVLRSLKALGTSIASLFATIWGTAAAKATEPAARTVKMAEKRMVKRVVKRVAKRVRRLLGLETTGGVDERLVPIPLQLL